MNHEDMVAHIRHARELLIGTIQGCQSPQIENMLRNADMELHLALWNLGDLVALRPELEYERKA